MRILRRLGYWLRLSSHHADLLKEVELHRAMVEEDLVRRGMSPADARIEARRMMGNETVMREESRAVRAPSPRRPARGLRAAVGGSAHDKSAGSSLVPGE